MVAPASTIDLPEASLETLDACPVCGSGDRSPLYEDLEDIVFGCAPGLWTMWLCDGCASAYLNPRPSSQAMPLIYQCYYTHEAPNVSHRGAVAPSLGSLRHELANERSPH